MTRPSRRPVADQRPTTTPVLPRRSMGRSSPPGPHLGPVRLTPIRVTLAIALVGSALFGTYAFTIRDASQIPLLAAGLLVLGIVFSALAISGAVATYRSAAAARSGLALAQAIVGGVAAVIAFGCLAGAVVLALVWRSPA